MNLITDSKALCIPQSSLSLVPKAMPSSCTHIYYLHQPGPRDAVEGKGPQRRPQKRVDRQLQEVAKAVGGSYCPLQMPLKLALAVKKTPARHKPGALRGGWDGIVSSTGIDGS